MKNSKATSSLRSLQEVTLYPIIESYFENYLGLDVWTEHELRGIGRKLRMWDMVPDVIVKEDTQILAIEAEPNNISDSWNHALGQVARFREVADRVYMAFPQPIPQKRIEFLCRLNAVVPATGLLEVDVASKKVKEIVPAETNKPANPGLRLKLWRELDSIRENALGRFIKSRVQWDRTLERLSMKWLKEENNVLKQEKIDAVNYSKSRISEVYGDEYLRYVPRVRFVDFNEETSSLRLAIDDPIEDLPDELMLVFSEGLEKEISDYVDEYEAGVVKVQSLTFKYCSRCKTLSVGKCRTCQDTFISLYNMHYADHASHSFF